MDDLQVARWLGFTFIQADQASWANFREVGLYEITAQAIRFGLGTGVISEQDFWGTDEVLWGKLNASPHPDLQQQLRRINPQTRFVRDPQNAEFWVATKLRSIDPSVMVNGKPQPLSQIDPQFAHERQHYLTSQAGKWPVYVDPPLR